MELTEYYSVDPTSCDNLARAYSGYADALRHEAEGEGDQRQSDIVGPREYRASCKAIAAGFFSLTDPKRALEAFAEAADLYLRLGRPFAVALAVCAQESAILERCRGRWELAQAGAANPEQMLHRALLAAMPVLVGQELRQRSEPYGWQDDLERYGWQAVGRLRLPLEHYLLLLETARRLPLLREEAVDPFRVASARFLRRAAESNVGAMQTGYLWTHMLTSRLPAEPEVLAPLVIAVISWRETVRRQSERLTEALGDHGLRPIEIAPLLVAEQLVEARGNPW